MKSLGDQNLTLLEQGRRAAVKAALDHAEVGDHEIAFEVTSDKTAEVSARGTKGRLSGAAYGKIVWGATKEYIAGVRGAWAFRKK